MQGEATHTRPSCNLPSLGAEATPTPLADQLEGPPPAPFLPPSPFFFCTESRRAGAGNSSSLVSEPVLFPVLCQNLFCFPPQGAGLARTQLPEERVMLFVLGFFFVTVMKCL